jgi:hypothetical protein
MASALEIAAFDFTQTDGVATNNMGQFEVPPDTVCLVELQVFAMRESDLAAKGWSFEVLAKRVGGGAVQIMEFIPSPVNLFGSTADVAALIGVSIAPFSDSMFLGVSCTGQAGDRIFWSAKVIGRRITL